MWPLAHPLRCASLVIFVLVSVESAVLQPGISNTSVHGILHSTYSEASISNFTETQTHTDETDSVTTNAPAGLHSTEEQEFSPSTEPDFTLGPITVDISMLNLEDLFTDEGKTEETPVRESWIQRIAHHDVKSPRRPGGRSLSHDQAESDLLGDFENLSWASQVITKAMWRYYPWSRSNSACTHQGEIYRQHFSNLTQWAVKMFDASDIAPDGILETDNLNSGHFDECLAIDVESLDMKGQYCLVKVEYSPYEEISLDFWTPDRETNYDQPDPMKTVWLDAKPHTDPARNNRSEFEFAVCLPKSCSAEDLQVSLQETINQVAAFHKLNFQLTVRSQDCSVKDPENPDQLGFAVTVSICMGAVTLVIISTLLDILIFQKSKSKSIFRTFLKSFSVVKNLNRLQKPCEDEEFAPVNYLKFQILVFIIFGHRIMFLFGNRLYNPSWIERLARLPLTAYVNGSSSVVVDTFFVIGGFLAYLFIHRTLSKKKRVNLLMIYVYRWLRIVPLYALIIALYTFVMPNLGDGPLWNRFVEREVNYCRKNWWLNLLFINNYVHADQLCMIHSWYLAVDMQLFILMSIVAVFIFNHPRKAKFVLGTLVSLSVVIPAICVYCGKYFAVIFAFQQFLKDITADPNFHHMYIKTHTRAIPYILGLTTAHVYLKLKEKHVKFTTFQLWVGVGLCFLLGNSAVLYSALLYLPGWPYNIVEHMVYNPLHRVMFALVPCFILIGQGTTGFGIASRFTSAPLFVSLGRLTYSAYLVHPIVQLIVIYSDRTSFSLSFIRIAWSTCGDVFMSFVLAVVLNLLFESPVDRLQKKIFHSFIREYKEPVKTLKQNGENQISKKQEVIPAQERLPS
nr:PREDICTED: nose resistant to fluoxetine protein 6-like [Bemisia tabaci]